MKILLRLLLTFSFFYSFGQHQPASVIEKLKPAVLELKDFIAQPNDALYTEHINQNINWLQRQFNQRNFTTKVLETSGKPLFFAESIQNPNLKTILFYMHFDGQSVDSSKWHQESPYKAVLKTFENDQWKTLDWNVLNEDINTEWRIFGRSVSDDKGPIVMFLQAIDLISENKKQLPFNVKVILDSEEEKGSQPLAAAVKKYNAILQADYLIINDGPLHASNRPTLVFGCRGITTLNLTTYGPIKPQHSGHFGNFAPNPGFILSKLLSTFKDDEGKVVIKGYYDGIHLDAEIENILKSVPENDADILKKIGVHTPDKVGSFYQEALQYPSLNIRGLSSGWTGKKARTIVPATATAAIDMRLVMESDGEHLKTLVKNHITNQGFFIVNEEPTFEQRLQHKKIIKITGRGVTQPFRTEMDIPFALWLENTLNENNTKSIVKIRTMGGTVPIASFINELKIPAIIVPMVNPDNNQHSPNENLKLKNIVYGIDTFYKILSTPINF